MISTDVESLDKETLQCWHFLNVIQLEVNDPKLWGLPAINFLHTLQTILTNTKNLQIFQGQHG